MIYDRLRAVMNSISLKFSIMVTGVAMAAVLAGVWLVEAVSRRIRLPHLR
jgi:hypothetical protein